MTPTASPPEPVPAASIILLRDGAGGLEVLMQQRRAQSSAFAGVLAFPGGKVAAIDRDPDFARHFAPDDFDFAEARRAALRELFEEAGLLVARLSAGARPDAERRAALARHRERVERDPGAWPGLLAEAGLTFAADALVPWSRWITPVFAPKRFDTFFFVAQAPADQAPLPGREAADYHWLRPADVVAEAERGERPVVFVTRMNLMRLAQHARVADALAAAARDPFVTVRPRKVDTEAGAFMQIDDAAPYPVKRMPFEAASTEIEKRRKAGDFGRQT